MARHDEGNGNFAIFAIRHADDCSRLHAGAAGDDPFDLRRCAIGAAADDDVLEPSRQMVKAAGIAKAKITGPEKSTMQRRAGQRLVLVIALERCRRLHQQLARLAVGSVATLPVDNADHCAWRGAAYGTGWRFARV